MKQLKQLTIALIALTVALIGLVACGQPEADAVDGSTTLTGPAFVLFWSDN